MRMVAWGMDSSKWTQLAYLLSVQSPVMGKNPDYTATAC